MSKISPRYLRKIYERLFAKYGPQSWWPAKTRFEVIVGAILTQNTSWTNVEKAIANLHKAHLLSPAALKNIPVDNLSQLIKPAGYFNVKARRLKNFIEFFFKEYNGQLERMSKAPLQKLRRGLLSVNGIGPETADSILLYALDKPVFVVDAYTKRILSRHRLMDEATDYHAVQKEFMQSLPQDTRMFNEYHALIVRLGKELCKSKPWCDLCPLNDIHYSIDYKCFCCRKPLPRPHERYVLNNALSPKRYFCKECWKKKGSRIGKLKI